MFLLSQTSTSRDKDTNKRITIFLFCRYIIFPNCQSLNVFPRPLLSTLVKLLPYGQVCRGWRANKRLLCSQTAGNVRPHPGARWCVKDCKRLAWRTIGYLWQRLLAVPWNLNCMCMLNMVHGRSWRMLESLDITITWHYIILHLNMVYYIIILCHVIFYHVLLSNYK